MRRNIITIFSLTAFFLLWIIFGFAAAVPREKSASQSIMFFRPNPPAISERFDEAGIPVTGTPQSVLGILLNDGLAGLAVLMMILIVLGAANKPTTKYAQQEETSATDGGKDSGNPKS
jgi:hypothetical protein